MPPPTFLVHESLGVSAHPPHQLALQFAKQAGTILVDPATRWVHFRKLRLVRRLRRGANRLIRYSPYALPRRGPARLLTDRINDWLWQRELMQLRPDGSTYRVIYDRPSHHTRVGMVKEDVAAYYAHCDYTVDIIGRHDAAVEADERRMLRCVDVAFAASPLLVERFKQYSSKVVHLSCGHNADLFDGDKTYPLPAILDGVPGPRLLLAGFVSGRVDFLGLIRTAIARPEWHFVVLGAISPDIAEELESSNRPADAMHRFFHLPNVHYLGHVPLQHVPEVVSHCDVGLVPYCLSAFTLGSSPIKTFEYLAMGKPVVATAAPEALALGPDVGVAEEGESYASAIEAALINATQPDGCIRRKNAVRDHSMQARAETVLRLLGS